MAGDGLNGQGVPWGTSTIAIDAPLQAHLDDTSDSHDAHSISTADGSNVQAKLDGLGLPAALFVPRAYGATEDGTDDLAALQACQDAASVAGGGCVALTPGAVYGIDTATTSLLLDSGVELTCFGGRAILQRVGTNTTRKMVQNRTFSGASTDNHITVRNVLLIGTGAEQGVSDQGACLGFWGADDVLLEDVETQSSNGDGIQYRACDRMNLRRIRIGTFGRNGISPTSGVNGVWDDVDVYGAALPGANPASPIDGEPNGTEQLELTWRNVRAARVTLVDFHTAEGGDFAIQMSMSGCRFSGGYPGAVRVVSSAKTIARHFYISPGNYLGAAGVAAGLYVGNVDGVRCQGPEINGDGGGSCNGIAVFGVVDDLTVDSPIFTGSFNHEIDSDNGTLNNARIKGCRNLAHVRLRGSNNRLDECDIANLELKGAASINNVIGPATYVHITLGDSATQAAQIFENYDGLTAVAAFGAAYTVPTDLKTGSIVRGVLDQPICTFTFPAPIIGKSFTLATVQDAIGGRFAAWPANAKWPSGAAPTLSAGPNKVDYITFLCTDGANWDGFLSGLDIR